MDPQTGRVSGAVPGFAPWKAQQQRVVNEALLWHGRSRAGEAPGDIQESSRGMRGRAGGAAGSRLLSALAAFPGSL